MSRGSCSRQSDVRGDDGKEGRLEANESVCKTNAEQTEDLKEAETQKRVTEDDCAKECGAMLDSCNATETPRECSVPYNLELEFSLPPSSYATVLLRELLRNDL